MMFKSLPTLILTLFLAACGGSSDAAVSTIPNDSVENLTGPAALFAEKGCVACHSIGDGPEVAIGPSIVELATRSSRIIEEASYTGNAETAEEYIRESILNPNIYIVGDYVPVMPKTYPSSLTEQEVAELVDYLLTFE